MYEDEERLLEMLAAARFLMEIVAEHASYESFSTDRKGQYAVRGALQILGEAARRVTKRFREQHPEVPWDQIIGTRHRVVHEYVRVNWAIVWTTLTVHVPALINGISPLIPPDSQLPLSFD